MSLMEHPQAQVLLQDAVLTSQAVVGCRERLGEYLQRYLPWFYREEQRDAARVIMQGKFTNLQRKTSEPIARQAKLKRRPLQQFVGAGKWDDQAVQWQMCLQVGEELGDPQAVLIVDPRSVAKLAGEP